MIPLILLSLHGFISILDAQQCGTNCSACTIFPHLCTADTVNRCIWNEDTNQCEVELCGPHCSLCDGSQNKALCENDPLCFWLVDNEMCRVKDSCGSNCELCLNETACDNIGAGGNTICGWDSGSCYGGTCNTACDACTDRPGEPLSFCANSTAPPNGCYKPEGGPAEACYHKTPDPTVDPTTNPTPDPTTNPTANPTTNPTVNPTANPSVTPSTPPTTTPTKTPSVSPTSSPTQAPISCGDERQGPLGSGQTTLIPLIVTQDLATLEINLCDTFTNFDSILTLYDNGGGIIATDDDGCGDSVGRSEIIRNNVVTDLYTVEVNNNGGNGLYKLKIICATFTPTTSPTTNPTDNPTTTPTVNPTDNPTTSPTVNPTVSPTVNPTTSPTANPTEDPTTAPNVGADEIGCGDDLIEYLPQGDEKIYSWILPFNATRIIINLCYEQTDFATDAQLLDSNDIIIKEDELCPSNATFIEINDGLNTGIYTIRVKGANDVTDYGDYRISIKCFAATTTTAPTINPTDIPTFDPTIAPTDNPTFYPTITPTDNPTNDPVITPTISPTNNPTSAPSSSTSTAPTHSPTINPTSAPTADECPDCPYNVSMIMIGNVSIEECPTSPPTTSISESFSSDSSDSSGSESNSWRQTSSDSDDTSTNMRGSPYAFTPIINTKCISWDNAFVSSASDDGTNQGSLDLDSIDSLYMRNHIWFDDKCDKRHRLLLSEHEWNTDDEFVTVVCIRYKIYDLLDDDYNATDCGQVTKVFLGLCENNKTDFNSSNIDEDDLTELIVSISPNDTTQISNAQGVRKENNDLGIVVEFAQNHDVSEFELCLGNVTVDSDFNQEKDTIDVGNGTVSIADIVNNETSHECKADGLPCLNFAFDEKCPKCQCKGGIKSLTMKHESDCKALSIVLYYDIENELHLCSFSNVESGATISCTPYLYDLYNDITYIRIIYDDDDDCVDDERRRRMTDEDSDSDSDSDSNEMNDAQCIDSFVTDCSVNLIGEISDGCGALKVISFIDRQNVRCYDESIMNEMRSIDNGDSGDHNYNALLNGEKGFKDALQTFVEFDPFIRWILIGIMITFIALMVIAFYICIVQRHKEIKRFMAKINSADRKKQQFQAKRHRLKSMDDDEDDFEQDERFENEFYTETDIESIMSPKDDTFDEMEMGRTTSNGLMH